MVCSCRLEVSQFQYSSCRVCHIFLFLRSVLAPAPPLLASKVPECRAFLVAAVFLDDPPPPPLFRAMAGRFAPAVFRRSKIYLFRGNLTAADCRELAVGLAGNDCVEELNVGGNPQIGDAGVAIIAECLGECRLKVLGLGAVGLGVPGCRALMQHLACSCVEELSLNGNRQIGDAGVGTVAERLTGSGLRSLHLWGVGLGDDGCRTLVQGLFGSRVEDLGLLANAGIRREGVEALRAACIIIDGLEVGGVPGLSRSPVRREPASVGDVVTVVDIIMLSGILPWLVAHPVFLYSGSD